MARIFRWLGLLTTVVWLVGQVFRDLCWATGLCFYAPSALVAGVLILVGLLNYRGSRQWSVLFLALAAGPLLFVVLAENRWTCPVVPTSPGPSVRLVHWNVFDGKLGWDGIAERLRSCEADFLAISEAPAGTDLRQAMGTDCSILRFDDMAVVARGHVRHLGRKELGRGRAHLLDWQSPGGPVKVLFVDLPSSIRIARAPLLQWVMEQADLLHPDIIIGDFNAPRRSPALTRHPARFSHAYDLAGSGWSSTWPMPVPLWAIDQCLLSPRIQALSYELRSSHRSDHRLQILDFRVRENIPRTDQVSVRE